MGITLVICIGIFLASLVIGRFFIPIDQVTNILLSKFLVLPITWDASMYNVVMEIRLPRVLGAIAVGIALANGIRIAACGIPKKQMTGLAGKIYTAMKRLGKL